MIDIGSRRECFFDDHIVDTEKTTAERRLHKPERRGVIPEFDKPWEGNMVTFPGNHLCRGNIPQARSSATRPISA